MFHTWIQNKDKIHFSKTTHRLRATWTRFPWRHHSLCGYRIVTSCTWVWVITGMLHRFADMDFSRLKRTLRIEQIHANYTHFLWFSGCCTLRWFSHEKRPFWQGRHQPIPSLRGKFLLFKLGQLLIYLSEKRWNHYIPVAHTIEKTTAWQMKLSVLHARRRFGFWLRSEIGSQDHHGVCGGSPRVCVSAETLLHLPRQSAFGFRWFLVKTRVDPGCSMDCNRERTCFVLWLGKSWRSVVVFWRILHSQKTDFSQKRFWYCLFPIPVERRSSNRQTCFFFAKKRTCGQTF